jgi:hypothetical protein
VNFKSYKRYCDEKRFLLEQSDIAAARAVFFVKCTKSEKVAELTFITWIKHGSTRTIPKRDAGR